MAAVAAAYDPITITPPMQALPQHPVPRIERIPLRMLRVALAEPGPGYQRAPNMTRVRKIASRWDWTMLDPLVVSVRRDGPHAGQYFVVDGQHRYLAALEVFPDTQEVPALMLHLTFEEEAMRFARQGENQIRVGARDLFIARLEGNDPDAHNLKAIAERTGWRISTSRSAHSRNNEIVAIGALTSIYNGWGPTILELTLQTLAGAYGHRYEAVDNRLMLGLAFFLYHFPVANVRELTDKLSRPEAQPKRLMQNAAIYMGTGGQYIPIARAIFDEYNRGRRQLNRLDWDLKKYRDLPKKGKK